MRLLVLALASVDAKSVSHSHVNTPLVAPLQSTLSKSPSAPDPAMMPTYELEGWCPDWLEGSSSGIGGSRSYFTNTTKAECFAKCDVDPICQQAKFEANGPHGDVCWLGKATMISRPMAADRFLPAARPVCATFAGCTDTCYNPNGWYPDGKAVVLAGWCNGFTEASSGGTGSGKSYWADNAITQKECFAKCDADPACQQARFEINGPHGNECWLGTAPANPRPLMASRGACSNYTGCANVCYSKAGWYPDHKQRVVDGWCGDDFVESSEVGAGAGTSYFHADGMTQQQCFASCYADAVCTQARFEALGEHGTECWLGVGGVKKPGPKRAACATHAGCVDLCYSKGGFK